MVRWLPIAVWLLLLCPQFLEAHAAFITRCLVEPEPKTPPLGSSATNDQFDGFPNASQKRSRLEVRDPVGKELAK